MRYNMASQTKGDLFFMEWQALLGVIAIIGIVVVVGGLIAFLGHVIIGAFDNEDRTTKQPKQEVMDYTQYKQQQALAEQTKQADYNFEAIDEAKAEKEKSLVEGNTEDDLYKLIEESDSDLDEIENRLKKENETTEDQPTQDNEIVDEKIVDDEPETTDVVETEQTEEVAESTETEQIETESTEEKAEETEEAEETVDDLDIQNLIDEINNEVVDEEKEKVDNFEDEENPILAQYNIDDILNNTESDEQTEEESEETEETETEDQEQVAEQVEVSETEQEETSAEETNETETVEQTEEVEKDVENKELEDANKRIAELTAQLEELNKQLSEQPTTTEVVTIDMTEDECLKRIAVLEERLKNAKKDYKTNMKEYRPLKKVMNDLDRYQTKLRRKEAIVAKKKVALYGVNNYVDIDKEKAEKLANELELLDGLRLSVNHCEEVINANKDRFPILEHTNNILEEQISQLEADLEETNATLKKIRDRQGNGENNQ